MAANWRETFEELDWDKLSDKKLIQLVKRAFAKHIEESFHIKQQCSRNPSLQRDTLLKRIYTSKALRSYIEQEKSSVFGNAAEHAAEHGRTKVLSKLLQSCGNLTRYVYVPESLKKAAANGHTETVDELIKSSESYISDTAVCLALFEAMSNGHTQTAETLFKSSSNPHEMAQTSLFSTGILKAVENHHLQTAERLVELCGDTVGLHYYDTAFYIISKINSHYQEAAQQLTQSASESKKLSNDLYIAAQNGNTEKVAWLLALQSNEYNPYHINFIRNKALCEAAANGHTQTVQKLFQLGAQVNAKIPYAFDIYPEVNDTSLYTNALYQAASNGHAQTVQMLIKLGADVNAQDNNGNTALHGAVLSKNIDAVKALIDAKADVNIPNKYGSTALHNAILTDEIEIVQALIDAQADLNAKDKEGKTPLHGALIARKVKTVQALLDAKADVNARDNDGRTPLFDAVLNGNNVELVETLINANADINARDNGNKTVLMKAARAGKVEMVKVLIQLGAQIDEDYADDWLPDRDYAHLHQPELKYRPMDPEANSQIKKLLRNADKIRADYLASHPQEKQNQEETQMPKVVTKRKQKNPKGNENKQYT